MRRRLKGEDSTAVTEPPVKTEYEEDLNCTPTGQLATSLGGETPSSMNIRRYSGLAATRQRKSPPAAPGGFRSRLRERVLRLTRFEPASVPPAIQSHWAVETSGYGVERLSFDSDRDLTIPALLYTPVPVPGPGPAPKRAAIYVDQDGKSKAGDPHAGVLALVKRGYAVLALDPAGIGNLSSQWEGYADQWFGQEKAARTALMIGRPLVGLEMRDIHRGIDVLAARGLAGPAGVLGVGRGLVSIALLHTAAIDSRFAGLVLEDMPVSYAAIACQPIHRKISEAVIPGVLREYDLPVLAAAMAPKPVCLVNTRSPLGNVMLRHGVEAEYSVAMQAYRTLGRSGSLTVRLRREGEGLFDAVPDIP